MKKTILPIVFLMSFLFSFQRLQAQPFTLLKDIRPFGTGVHGSHPRNFIAVNNVVYFTADNPNSAGGEIWKTDGTNVGTVPVQESAVVLSTYSVPMALTGFGETLYFFRRRTNNSAAELWKTDGTSLGTKMVKSFAEANVPEDGTPMAALNGAFYFSAKKAGKWGLWKSDGTINGTVLVKETGYEFQVTTASGTVNGLLYFVINVDDGASNNAYLWRTDGTGAGTFPVHKFWYFIYPLTNVNGVLFFAARDLADSEGNRLWKMDGAGSLTGISPLDITSLTNVNGALFFLSQQNGTNEAKVWTCQRDEETPVLVKSFRFKNGYLRQATSVDGSLYFGAVERSFGDDSYGADLWKSNGTEAGTIHLKHFPVSDGFEAFTCIGNQLLFWADDGIYGNEIWKSNGTPEGTLLLQDAEPGPVSLANFHYYGVPAFLAANGKIFTSINTTMYGVEPWVANDLVNDGPECAAPTSRLYVNAANTSSGSGSSWQCAIKELRDAVAIANANPAITEIWVAKGTYKPTAGTDRTASITISGNVTSLNILGGFAGVETAAAAANPVSNVTIISGDIGIAGNMADNSYHIVRVTGVADGNIIAIDGFVLEKGNADDPNLTGSEHAYGGAMILYSNRGYPHISRCLFTGNRSSSAGGAVAIYDSTLTSFDSCVFIGNSSGNGGALASYSSRVDVTNSLFSQNTATAGSGGAVMGIDGSFYSTFRFKNTRFDRNTALVNGGAAHLQYAWYQQCVFNGNSAASGGAIYQKELCPEIANCTFFGNSATITGGAVVFKDAPATSIRNSIFWKNKKGGADNVPGADFTILPFISSGNNFYANFLQSNTSVPANNGSFIGIDPLFVNEGAPAGADGWFGYLNDGLDLQNTSPAKNIGFDFFAMGLTTDMLGRPRIACGGVDLGAYENQACVAPIAKNTGKISPNNEATVTNPFRNNLLIRYTGAEKADVEISSLSGQKMWKGSAIQKGQTQVNTASWPSGLYQVTIRTAANKPMVFKVVKAQ